MEECLPRWSLTSVASGLVVARGERAGGLEEICYSVEILSEGTED